MNKTFDRVKHWRQLPWLILFFGTVLAALLTHVLYKENLRENHAFARQMAEARGLGIQQAIQKRGELLHVMGAFIEDGGADEAHLRRTAERVYGLNSELLENIQLAPGGVLNFDYPRVGNMTQPLDLLHDRMRSEEAIYAREHHEMAMDGPRQTRNSGRCIIVRFPVYAESSKEPDKFWGFVITLVKMEDILHESAVDGLVEQGYNYSLTKHMRASRAGQNLVVETSKEAIDSDAEGFSFEVPGHSMTLAISPKEGWVDWKEVAPIGIGMEIIIALLALLVYHYQKMQEQKELLEDVAATDPLTGIYNRRGGDKVVLDYITEHPGEKAVLICVDIDNFKRLNDAYGHLVGDLVLKHVTGVMRECFGEKEIYVRNGGDEFYALLRHDLEHVSEKIAQFANTPKMVYTDDNAVQYKISLGYVDYPEQAASFNDLMRKADSALYYVKMNGKDDYVRYEHYMSSVMRTQLAFNITDIAGGMPGGLLVYRANSERQIMYVTKGIVELFGCRSLQEFMDFVDSSYNNVLTAKQRKILQEQSGMEPDELEHAKYMIKTLDGAKKLIEAFGSERETRYYGRLHFVYMTDLPLRANAGEETKANES